MLSYAKGCEDMEAFEKHLIRLQHYKFVLSPPGLAPDAHRTWEALMMGCIPIVLQGPLDELYKGLPVLMLQSWDQMTMDKLQATYADLRYGQQSFEFEKLFTPYWFHLIDNTLQTFSLNGSAYF